MRPVSQSFLDILDESHTVGVAADVWYDGQLVARDLSVVAGSLKMDSWGDVRTQVALTIADADGSLVPFAATDPVNCYGQEINLRCGVRATTGTVQLVSMGWYRIQGVKAQQSWRTDQDGNWEGTGALIEIDALDRLATIGDYRFMSPDQPASGATCLGEMRRLVQPTQVPIGPVGSDVTDTAVPWTVIYEESRVGALRDLASVMDAYPAMDADGQLVVKRRPSPTSTPHYTIKPGEDGLLVSSTVERTRDGVYNAVVVRTESDPDSGSTPLQAIALDIDPASPTRWDGPYRRVPTFLTSSFFRSQAAVNAAAVTRLNSVIRGRDRLYTVRCAPLPFVEPGDVVAVELPDRRLVGLVDKAELPLTPSGGSMTLEVRVLETGETRVEYVGAPSYSG